MSQIKEALWELLDDMTSGSCWCGTFRTMFENEFHFELCESRVLVEKETLINLVSSVKKECKFNPGVRHLVHLLNSWDLTIEENFGFNISIIDDKETYKLIERIGELTDELSRTTLNN